MKRSFTYIFIFLAAALQGQEFFGATGAIIDNGGQDTYFDCGVSGLPDIDGTFGIIEVKVSINHAQVKETTISLISPWGTKVELTGALSLQGTNFTNTVFRSDNPKSITLAVAPFSGTFRPNGYLGRFNTGKSPNGTWKLEVKDFVLNNAGSVVSWSIKFGQNPPAPVILQSSNLPIVFINTGGNAIGETEILADFGIIDNNGNRNYVADAKNEYNGKAAIHLRGSSSKMFEKKNMKVELRDNTGQVDVEVPLLGMSLDHDWILTAFYNDKSLMRNALTQHLFTKMGRWSPRFRYVELVVNGEYNGIYLLMEQIKRGDERISIAKMTELDNQEPYISGGYIVQINRTDDPGWFSKFPGVSSSGAKFYYQYNYPKADRITEPQKNYIKAQLDEFETVMNGPDFANPSTGYLKYIDDNSFIDYMIINEFSKNVDAYKLSTYLYKENSMDGGKLFIGPPWDYDLAWHNVNYGDAFNEQYWQYKQPANDYPIPTWWDKFMQDDAFKDKLYCRYHSLRAHTLSNNQIYEFIDGTAAMLAESRQRNFKQFPVIGTYVFGNPQEQQGATYESEVQDLKNWVAARGGWLDGNVPGFCDNVSVTERGLNGLNMALFPNPFSDRLHVEFDLRQAHQDVFISIYDITGAQAIEPVRCVNSAGSHRQSINAASIAAGSYIVELNVDGRKYHGKLIKTSQ